MSDATSKPLPIATYREVRFDGKRTIELFDNSVRIVGSRTLQSSFDASIPLSGIVPVVNRFLVRNGLFWMGVWLFKVGFIGDAILISGLKIDAFSLASGMLGCVAIGGVLLCIATWRKVEIAQFTSDVGLPVLDIVRAGPDRQHFEAFVAKVLEQVRLAREKAGVGR